MGKELPPSLSLPGHNADLAAFHIEVKTNAVGLGFFRFSLFFFVLFICDRALCVAAALADSRSHGTQLQQGPEVEVRVSWPCTLRAWLLSAFLFICFSCLQRGTLLP